MIETRSGSQSYVKNSKRPRKVKLKKPSNVQQASPTFYNASSGMGDYSIENLDRSKTDKKADKK